MGNSCVYSIHHVPAGRIYILIVGRTFEGDFVTRNSPSNHVVGIRAAPWYFRGRAGQVGALIHPPSAFTNTSLPEH